MIRVPIPEPTPGVRVVTWGVPAIQARVANGLVPALMLVDVGGAQPTETFLGQKRIWPMALVHEVVAQRIFRRTSTVRDDIQ